MENFDQHTAWAEISTVGDGLPESARDEVLSEILSARNDNPAFEVAHPYTRKAVNDAIKCADHLLTKTDYLLKREDYSRFNTGGEPLSTEELSNTRACLIRLVERLYEDRNRLSIRSARDRERLRPIRFIVRLLEMQAYHLNRDPPVDEGDKRHLRFLAYLRVCLRFAGFPEDVLERSMPSVIGELRRRKKTGRSRGERAQRA
jgi:hypothetical protein